MSIAFIQARHYTANRNVPISLIVIHDMEYPERLDTAEAVAKWFAGSTAPQASTHYNVDADSVVQSVKDSDVAWCAPGANSQGLHFEHAGYARQTEAEWLDAYGKKMLDVSAALVAEKCIKYGIPVKHLTIAELRAGQKGIVGHGDVGKAFGKTTHTDPGPNFPWTYYIGRVAHFKAQKTGTPAPAPAPAPKPAPTPTTAPRTLYYRSSGVLTGADVKRLQSELNRVFPSYSRLSVDGKFGPATDKVVREFQRRANLGVDGRVGPATRKKMASFGLRLL